MSSPVDFTCVLADLQRRRDAIVAMIQALEAFMGPRLMPIVLAAATPGRQPSATRGVKLERRSNRSSKARQVAGKPQARKVASVPPGGLRQRARAFQGVVLAALTEPSTAGMLATRLKSDVKKVWYALKALQLHGQVTRTGKLYVRKPVVAAKAARPGATTPAADVVWSGRKDDAALTGGVARQERP